MTVTPEREDIAFPLLRKCPYTPPDEYVKFRETEAPTPGQLYNGRRVWLVTRYEQVRAILGDERFSSDITNPGYPIYAEAFEGSRGFPMLFTMDPPQHTVQRKAVIREFTLRRAEDLRPQMQRKADELIDAMLAEGNSADLVEKFAGPFSGIITCWALGMEYSDMQAWLAGNREVREKAHAVLDTEQVGAEVSMRMMALQEYFLRFIEAKEEEPGDDPVSRVIAQHVTTGTLSRTELANLCFLIFIAGQTPVQAMLTVGVGLLLERPDQLALVRDDPKVLPGTVDEMMRMVSPLDLMARVALEDVEVGGQLIRAGEGLLVANGGANHDPAEFPDPGRLDVRRAARGHLAFGSGIHHCLGANLTRVGLEVAYGTLFRRLPGLRLAVPMEEMYDRPLWHPELQRMPVTW
ncbi:MULTISPECIES: cytochrome P450 [Streptomyces]|uniref:Cytochrome P450 n=1 Tax=Streptomyces caniscabiei TaxID=2746961 RepID=A0ABU4MX28_9ACTN|nr:MULTISPECIES: cytochrome P450 [Streptomyces]MBE4740785.1 cytochrome P450 [Streptomyces caniscabiei]MBE4760661.1 cytochrome P450 [Streptomyces caniscabiei]MBE4774659.1 cytochrome P450 [Streptomyces caniscabiei]MBE4788920.1 cytochrome P450 [Streptomyces caniscabiei]MBE4798525.1 cytochrome P450 [Streptomyces caniscabiei]